MKKNILASFLGLSTLLCAQTVTTLEANGPGNTYEDINAVLAPGISGDAAIEAPGITIDNPAYPNCSNHDDFNNGEATNSHRHIQEVYDADLDKNVFKFYLHVDEDIDRDKCETTDRQRNEIKSYASSPDYLKGVLGETVEYKWKFKLDAGFQGSSSFTHIHQLKSVGGITAEESLPMITLTAYSSSLVLRYSATQGDQATVSGTSVSLNDLRGNWVEVIETITYGYEGDGSYSITITDLDNNQDVFMSYSNNTLRWYKTDADFIRPKWGIYRSLNNAAALRDEEVLYADFSITEWPDQTLSNESFELVKNGGIHPNPAKDYINLPFSSNDAGSYVIEISNTLGAVVMVSKLSTNTLSIENLKAGLYFFKITDTQANKSVVKKLIKL